MAMRHRETEQIILKMLQQYRVMTMDDILAIGKPAITWSKLFFAVDRLSRKRLIALSRIGSTYQLTFNIRERS